MGYDEWLERPYKKEAKEEEGFKRWFGNHFDALWMVWKEERDAEDIGNYAAFLDWVRVIYERDKSIGCEED